MSFWLDVSNGYEQVWLTGARKVLVYRCRNVSLLMYRSVALRERLGLSDRQKEGNLRAENTDAACKDIPVSREMTDQLYFATS